MIEYNGMPLPKRPLLPYLALLGGILALGFSALFVRWADAPGPVTGFYRMTIAALILAPLAAGRLRRQVRVSKGVLLFPVLGGLLTAGDHAFWNTAISYTTAANATLLNYTAPLWVALFSWVFLRRRLGGRFWMGLGLALAGGGVVLARDFLLHPSLGFGDLLALISSLFYGGYFLVTEAGRRRFATLPYLWVVTIVAAVSLLAISLVFGLPLSGYPPATYLAFLGAALVSQIGGYFAVGYALGHLPAAQVSPTMIGQPVLTALLAVPLLGEALNPFQAVGGLAVLLGITLINSRPAGAALSAGSEAAEAVL